MTAAIQVSASRSREKESIYVNVKTEHGSAFFWVTREEARDFAATLIREADFLDALDVVPFVEEVAA